MNETEDFKNADGSAFSRSRIDWDELNDFSGVGEFNLVGLLKEDVNGSWPAPAQTGLESLPNSYFTDSEVSGVGPAEQWWVV